MIRPKENTRACLPPTRRQQRESSPAKTRGRQCINSTITIIPNSNIKSPAKDTAIPTGGTTEGTTPEVVEVGAAADTVLGAVVEVVATEEDVAAVVAEVEEAELTTGHSTTSTLRDRKAVHLRDSLVVLEDRELEAMRT